MFDPFKQAEAIKAKQLLENVADTSVPRCKLSQEIKPCGCAEASTKHLAVCFETISDGPVGSILQTFALNLKYEIMVGHRTHVGLKREGDSM